MALFSITFARLQGEHQRALIWFCLLHHCHLVFPKWYRVHCAGEVSEAHWSSCKWQLSPPSAFWAPLVLSLSLVRPFDWTDRMCAFEPGEESRKSQSLQFFFFSFQPNRHWEMPMAFCHQRSTKNTHTPWIVVIERAFVIFSIKRSFLAISSIDVEIPFCFALQTPCRHHLF